MNSKVFKYLQGFLLLVISVLLGIIVTFGSGVMNGIMADVKETKEAMIEAGAIMKRAVLDINAGMEKDIEQDIKITDNKIEIVKLGGKHEDEN